MDHHHKIPIWIKLIYSAFVAVLVPYYWVTYSPWNFLFFCDLGLLIGVVALWTEDPLLASLPTVGWQSAVPLVPRLPDRGEDHGDDQLHVRPQAAPVRPRPVVVPRLAAVPLALDGLAAGLRPPGLPRLDRVSWSVFLASFFLAPPPPARATTPTWPSTSITSTD